MQVAWRCALQVRSVYHQDTPAAGRTIAEQVLASFTTCPASPGRPPGRTLKQWREAFLGSFTTGGANNGGTEAVNGLIELHRRVTRDFRNRDNCRLRMLLIGGGLQLSSTLRCEEPVMSLCCRVSSFLPVGDLSSVEGEGDRRRPACTRQRSKLDQKEVVMTPKGQYAGMVGAASPAALVATMVQATVQDTYRKHPADLLGRRGLTIENNGGPAPNPPPLFTRTDHHAPSIPC